MIFTKIINFIYTAVAMLGKLILEILLFLLFPLGLIIGVIGVILEGIGFLNLDGFMKSEEDNIIDESKWVYS